MCTVEVTFFAHRAASLSAQVSADIGDMKWDRCRNDRSAAELVSVGPLTAAKCFVRRRR